MALPTLTWTKPTVKSYIISSAGADGVKDVITAIYDVFNTTGVTGWSVADYSATEAHLILKPSDISVSNMRIALFGGQNPSSGMFTPFVGGSAPQASSSYLYMILSKDVGVDTFDQSYTLGHPWATSDPDCAGAIFCGSASTAYDRIQVYACEEGLVIHNYDASGSSNQWYIAGALQKLIHAPNDRGYIFMTSPNVTSSFWAATNSEGIPYGDNLGSSARAIVYDGNDIRAVARQSFGNPDNTFKADWASNFDNTNQGFLPIFMMEYSIGYFMGYLRQIYFGPRAKRDIIIVNNGSTLGYGVATSNITSDNLWLLNQ